MNTRGLRLLSALSLFVFLAALCVHQAAFAARPAPSESVSGGRSDAAAVAAFLPPPVLRVPADFPTIQSAVDAAAPGGSILVLPGTYIEQITINKNLRLVGSGIRSTVIRAPATLAPNAYGRTYIVEINNGARVTMSRLTVTGPGAGSCVTGDGINRGISVVDDATLDLSSAAITHIHDTPILADCVHDGNGIVLGAIFTAVTGHATIFDVSISDYQAAGINVFNEGSTATISHNVITGPDPSEAVDPIGIGFGFGAVATITHNVISGNLCDSADLGCGPDPITQFQAAAIGPFEAGAGSVVAFNTLVNNDIGIYVLFSPDSIESSHNNLINNRYFGLAIQDGSGASSFDRIVGGQVGVGVIADSVDTVATLNHEFIALTSMERIKEISCCRFTATAIVKGGRP